MIDYVWKFSKFNTKTINGQANCVFRLDWSLEGTDGNFGASHNGILNLETENIENFIEFDNLTQEIVEGWVTAALGESTIVLYKEIIETRIKELNDQSAATVRTAPWIPEPVMEPEPEPAVEPVVEPAAVLELPTSPPPATPA